MDGGIKASEFGFRIVLDVEELAIGSMNVMKTKARAMISFLSLTE